MEDRATSTEEEEDVEMSSFYERLARGTIRVKTFEVTQRKIETLTWITLATSFTQLETLIGAFDLKPLESYRSLFYDFGSEGSIRLLISTFRLRRFEIYRPTTQAILDQVLSTSFDSLTSLSLQISYKSQIIDISPSRNLRSLCSILSAEQPGSH